MKKMRCSFMENIIYFLLAIKQRFICVVAVAKQITFISEGSERLVQFLHNRSFPFFQYSEMLFGKGPPRTGFQICFKSECFGFVVKPDLDDQFPWAI